MYDGSFILSDKKTFTIDSKQKILVLGPCAAESQQQLLEAAQGVIAACKHLSAFRVIFRAGAWKPRTQPGFFEGMGERALGWLRQIQDDFGIEVATEVATEQQTRLALSYGIRTLWIGARTTTNPFLVRQIADACSEWLKQNSRASSVNLTIMVKNPVSPDLMLWQGALLRFAGIVGEENVVAVHRGFTGGTSGLRNAPKWSLALQLHHLMPHVPLLLDPSHLAGDAVLVPQVAKKAVELAYNGLMIEMHPKPEQALSDAAQQLTPRGLSDLLRDLYATEVTSSQATPSTAATGLAAFRAQFDELDDELWQLILRRMELSVQIGNYKRQHHIPVLQSDRWQQLVHDRLVWAEKNNLSEENVMRILDAIHDESRRQQGRD
ncbi:MAG: bifunctional 3-deoxy-7-phosphoheptulonate synthase/chorismate mutase type II [Paludibacteraceae bacterium]|nr:bifunctional 3-deoxy-7-phosphoheptulonate synthase/chorismate mutase type II [Paludibacteraceae bacterium]